MDKNIYLAQFYGKSQNYTQIPREWFSKYGVKRGLRNEDHTGVLVGLTRIADVVGYRRGENDQKIDCDGILYYRGIDIRELVKETNYKGYLYEEASFKPYIIAAMIMLSKFENPQDILKKLEVKAAPRILK